MTRAGTIPLSQIAKIQIYDKPVRNNKSGMRRVLQATGGDFCMNGPIFLKGLKACCHLKADGRVLCAPDYTAWGISWNGPEDYGVKRLPNGDANCTECVHVIVGGKPISPIHCGADMRYAAPRTAIGVKEGRFAYYAGQLRQTPEQLLIVGGKPISPIHCGADMRYAAPRTAIGVKEGRFAYYAGQLRQTPEQLRDMLAGWGWSDAIMMDGGGSTCYLDKDGNGFAGDGRTIPFWIVVTLRKDEREPKGEKPMVEINAYSKAKDGGRKLSAHFKAREFACKDGSDPIFVARTLPLVLEYIRMRVGKAVVINSAYRTPEHNAKEGGAVYSQQARICATPHLGRPSESRRGALPTTPGSCGRPRSSCGTCWPGGAGATPS